MQCVNCHFENLPGSAGCGRCGMTMRLDEAPIDVHPPRARGWWKWLRQALPLRRAAATARDVRNSALLEGRLAALGDAWPVLVRMPVPGLPQFYLRQRARGQLFAWGFVVLCVAGLMMIATLPGAVLLGLAFSVHVSGILDVMNHLSPAWGVRRQLFRSVAIFILLLGLLYLPVLRMVRAVADPLPIQLSAAPMQAGDVVLVNRMAYRWSAPRPGDVVLYSLGRHVHSTQNPVGGGRMNIVHEGERIDRIIARPGDQVLWTEGQLTVNGTPVVMRPLNAARLPPRLAVDVPASCYLILPTTSPSLHPASGPELWHSLSLVPRERIHGRVYLRAGPLWRIGRF